MARGPVCVLMLSTLAIAGLAVSNLKALAADADLKAEVLRVEEERETALLKGDIATLDRIDADDLVYTNWRGVTLTKAQHLDDVKARQISFQSSPKHTDVQVTIHGNTGIITGTSTTNMAYKGSSPGGARRFVNVYVKEGKQWVCVVHFEAPVAR